MITTSLEEQRIPDVPDVQGVNLDYLQGLHNPSDSLSSIHDISQHIPVSEVSNLNCMLILQGMTILSLYKKSNNVLKFRLQESLP